MYICLARFWVLIADTPIHSFYFTGFILPSLLFNSLSPHDRPFLRGDTSGLPPKLAPVRFPICLTSVCIRFFILSSSFIFHF